MAERERDGGEMAMGEGRWPRGRGTRDDRPEKMDVCVRRLEKKWAEIGRVSCGGVD